MKNVLLLLVLATIAACGGKGGSKGINGVNGVNGAQGLQGIQGIQGEKGEPGTDTFWEQYLLWRETHPNGNGIGDFMNWLRGQQGEQGIQGIQGFKGDNGSNGSNGKSALQGWIDLGCEGYDGVCADATWGIFMRSIHGKDGLNGLNGKSAYELWVDKGCDGFVGTCSLASTTVGDFMKTLHGKDGSAYASHADKVSDFSGLTALSTETKMKALVKGFTGKLNYVVVQSYDNNSTKSTYSVYDLTNYVIGDVTTAKLVDTVSVDQMGNSGVFKVTLKDGSSNLLTADSDSSKDVEQMGSKLESAKVDEVKGTLLQYGLSAERTEKLSKLLVSYKQIANKRALNATEKDQFTKELLGMSFEKAAKEMVENYEGLMEKAADKNGTSPEAVKELVGQMLSM